MIRIACLIITAVLLSLLAISAQAAPTHKRSTRWHGYGFLPGYEQPLSNTQPIYSARKQAIQRYVQRARRPWYIDPTPAYYSFDGNWRYFGRPGFRGNRFNGGSLGPCWTRTPIGPVWNCGR